MRRKKRYQGGIICGMNEKELEKLAASGETETVEFKESTHDSFYPVSAIL
jgi:hypothetical protein